MEDDEALNKRSNQFIPPPGPGRPPGMANKLTARGREAIVLFIESNAHRMQDWLDMLANGYKTIEVDRDGADIIKTIPPNPSRAAEIYISLVEYVIPKLSRSEISGVEGGPPISIIRDNIRSRSVATVQKQDAPPDTI